MRISATDIDDGNNSLVFYNLDNTLDSSYFRIDENSGVIYLNKTIDVSIIFSFKTWFDLNIFILVEFAIVESLWTKICYKSNSARQRRKPFDQFDNLRHPSGRT